MSRSRLQNRRHSRVARACSLPLALRTRPRRLPGPCQRCGGRARATVEDATETPAGTAVAAVSGLLGHGDAASDGAALRKTRDDMEKADDGGVLPFTLGGGRWKPGRA